jgi:hypothetical protein
VYREMTKPIANPTPRWSVEVRQGPDNQLHFSEHHTLAEAAQEIGMTYHAALNIHSGRYTKGGRTPPVAHRFTPTVTIQKLR